MKELSARPEEIEFLQQKPKKESVTTNAHSLPNTTKLLPADNQDDSDSDASLVEMLQSIIVSFHVSLCVSSVNFLFSNPLMAVMVATLTKMMKGGTARRTIVRRIL